MPVRRDRGCWVPSPGCWPGWPGRQVGERTRARRQANRLVLVARRGTLALRSSPLRSGSVPDMRKAMTSPTSRHHRCGLRSGVGAGVPWGPAVLVAMALRAPVAGAAASDVSLHRHVNGQPVSPHPTPIPRSCTRPRFAEMRITLTNHGASTVTSLRCASRDRSSPSRFSPTTPPWTSSSRPGHQVAQLPLQHERGREPSHRAGRGHPVVARAQWRRGRLRSRS